MVCALPWLPVPGCSGFSNSPGFSVSSGFSDSPGFSAHWGLTPLWHYYLPESFEWLILISGVVKDGDISRILDNPSEYIESGKYMSWEQFFTALLVEKTRDSYLKYAKSKLNISYKNETIVQKIIDEIPEGLGFVKYSV